MELHLILLSGRASWNFLSLEKIKNYYFNIKIKNIFLTRIYTFSLVVIFFIPFGLPSFDSLLFCKTINISEIFNISQREKFYVVRNIILILILLIMEIFINKKDL